MKMVSHHGIIAGNVGSQFVRFRLSLMPMRTRRPDGFTLLEIIVSMFILGIAIAPMVGAFAPTRKLTNDAEAMAVFVNQARGTLTRVADLDYEILNLNIGNPVDLNVLFGSPDEAAKEIFSFEAVVYAPVVSITDASGGQGGLLEITVTIEHVSLKTLKADY
jgi:prepilin-type N-terminal cleavage/methylation domain-containing protein